MAYPANSQTPALRLRLFDQSDSSIASVAVATANWVCGGFIAGQRSIHA